jgi:hypothetical protein
VGTTVTINGSYVTSVTPFIKASYSDFLGRQPSAGEVQAQASALYNGTSRTAYLRGLANSDAWLNAIVTKMYMDTLGRQPDATGLANWVNALRAKTLTVAQAASQFYSSDEFYQNLGGNSKETWIKALYSKLLNRGADPQGLAYWLGRTGDTWATRTPVAYDFYQSVESRQHRVTDLYQALLQRGTDPTGLPYWTDRVLSMGDIELAVSLASSQEYWDKAQIRFPN